MVWKIVSENDTNEKTLHVGESRQVPGDVTSIVSCLGRVMSYDQENHAAIFAGADDGFVAMYDGNLNFEKDWQAEKHGVNCIAVGKDDHETLWLYSCSAYGEIKQWWPAAVELIYQNTAWHPGGESKGFTSAGGTRESSVKQLYWHDGNLYSGDDAGLICKWDCMLNMTWNTNVYSDVASLTLTGSEEDNNLKVFAGNLVTSQIIVGDLRQKKKPQESLEVATTIPGKGPVCSSPNQDVFICACFTDYSILVNTYQKGSGWMETAKLENHTDQVTGLSISEDGSKLASCSWDGTLCIWSLESHQLVASIKCGEYLNCVCWGSEPGTVYAGGKEGAVVKLADVS